MLVFQSKAQLRAKYPNDYQIIQDNCELMTLIKTKDTELANNLSKAFGTYEKKEKTEQKDKDGQTTGTNWHTRTVPVLSETEILEMPRGKILIWLAGKKPIITKTMPIDQTRWYKKNIEEHDHTFKPIRLLTEHREFKENEGGGASLYVEEEPKLSDVLIDRQEKQEADKIIRPRKKKTTKSKVETKQKTKPNNQELRKIIARHIAIKNAKKGKKDA